MAPRGKGRQAVNANIDANPDGEHIKSMAEVEAEASLRSSRLHDAQTSLAFILSRYEDRIRNRWHKKDHRKRHAVLLSAYPGMPLRYRPNPELFDPRQHKAVHRGQAFLDACKFPALNQEGLEADTRGQGFYDIWPKMAAVR